MKDPFINRLVVMAERDPRIMLVVGDLGFGMVERFLEKYPKRFLNVGVAEQNMIGVATGLALEGYVPYVYSIANFATLRCFEQIRNDAAYHDANVKVVAMGGGFSYGALGISHHATEDLAIMRTIPGITAVAPGDDWEAGEATEALSKQAGVGYLRLDKSSAAPTTLDGEVFTLGKARTLREGRALTLVATGGILGEVLGAAARLEREGVDCRVLSMHTFKPMDKGAVLRAAAETGGIVTVEEHTLDGGLGSAVAETLLDAGVAPRSFLRMGLRAGFSSVVGSQTYLRKVYELDESAIFSRVKELVAPNSKSTRQYYEKSF